MSVFDKWKGRSLTGFDLKKLKRHFLPYSVLVAALFAMTFFGVCVPDMGPRGPKGPAAFIQDEVVTFREFRWIYQGLLDSTRNRMGEDFDPQDNSVAQEALSQLVTSHVGFLMARELGLGVSDQAVIEHIKDQSYFQNDQGQFDNELVSRAIEFWGITADIYKNGIERDLTLTQLQDLTSSVYFRPSSLDQWRSAATSSRFSFEYLVVDSTQMSPDVAYEELRESLEDETFVSELRIEYQRQIHLYQQPGGRKVRQILIAYQGARNAFDVSRSQDQASDLARQIHDQLIKDPAQFEQLVAEFSDDLKSKDKQGDMGLIQKDQLTAEISEAVFALNLNEISDVVTSPFGYHIFDLTEIQEPIDVSFDEIKTSLAESRLQDQDLMVQARQLANQVLVTLRDSPSDFDQLARDHSLKWQFADRIDLLTNEIAQIPDVDDLKIVLLTAMAAHEDLSQAKGQVIDQVFESEDKVYVLRLKDFAMVSLDEIHNQDINPLQDLSSFYERMAEINNFYLFQSLVRYVQDQWISDRKIRINQDYLALDSG